MLWLAGWQAAGCWLLAAGWLLAARGSLLGRRWCLGAVWLSDRAGCGLSLRALVGGLALPHCHFALPIPSLSSLPWPAHRRTVNTSAETCTSIQNYHLQLSVRINSLTLRRRPFRVAPCTFPFSSSTSASPLSACGPTLNVSLPALPFRHLHWPNASCWALRCAAIIRIPPSHPDALLSDPFRSLLRACSRLNASQTLAGSWRTANAPPLDLTLFRLTALLLRNPPSPAASPDPAMAAVSSLR